jgi:hydroxysqualene dehydroxylase
MQKVLVIGGGLAGLSAAVHLAKNKTSVLLLEAARQLGGRVSSFLDKQSGLMIDNGQHIMMGCYYETLDFIDIINARQNFFFQKNLEITFYNEGHKSLLQTNRGVYPFNFLKGLLSFNLLSLKDRVSLVNFFIKLPVSSTRDIRNSTAEEWLVDNNQGVTLRNIFWNTFIIGALNTTPDKASALILRDVLFRVFFSGRNSSAIIIPARPLSEAFCNPAFNYLVSHNAEVSCSEMVLKITADNKNNII